MILSKSAIIINEKAKKFDLLLTSVTFTIAVCNAILIL